VLGLGFMLLGEKSREITQRLRHKMEEVKKLLPPGVEIEEVYARTDLVDKVSCSPLATICSTAPSVGSWRRIFADWDVPGWRAGA